MSGRKSCRLTKYLLDNDPELYQAFDDLCLFGLLRINRVRGITFLYPESKSYRQKIINAAYSDNIEPAIDMIKSIILFDFFKTPSEFIQKQNDIPNALRQKVAIDKLENDSVKLKCGVSLKLDPKFTPLQNGDPTAVYIMSGTGMIPTNAESASLEYASQVRTKKTQVDACRELLKFVKWVETSYAKNKYIYEIVMCHVYKLAIDLKMISNVYPGITATARSSFYTVLSPYCNFGLSDVSSNDAFMQSVYKIMDTDKSAYDIYLSNYMSVKKKIASVNNKAREQIAANKSEQLKILKYAIPGDLANTVYKKYGSSLNKLAADLFSIYTYMCSKEESMDSRAFKNGFCWSIKNVFNTVESIIHKSTDIAHNMSMFGTLVRTDAYKYVPYVYGKDESVDFKYSDYLDPMEKTLFSINSFDSMARSSKKIDRNSITQMFAEASIQESHSEE
jgi:hypothetical protein